MKIDCAYDIYIPDTTPPIRVYIHQSWVNYYQQPIGTAITYIRRAIQCAPRECRIGEWRVPWRPFEDADVGVGLLLLSTIKYGRNLRLIVPKYRPHLEICFYTSKGDWPQIQSRTWAYYRGKWKESLGLFAGTSLPILSMESAWRTNTPNLQHYVQHGPAIDGIEEIVRQRRQKKDKDSVSSE